VWSFDPICFFGLALPCREALSELRELVLSDIQSGELISGEIHENRIYLLTTIFGLFVFNISQAAEPLTLIQTVPLPVLREGDFDHFALDLTGQRLFLTAEKGVVEVFDLRTNELRVHKVTP